MLVLHHFVPTRFYKRAVLAEVRRDFAGPVVVGEDLMRLDVGTGALNYAGAEIGLGDGVTALLQLGLIIKTENFSW